MSDVLAALLSVKNWQSIIVAAAVTLPLGITQGKEYAETVWYIDLWIAVVWVALIAVVFCLPVFNPWKTWETFNFTGPILVLAALFVGGWWSLSAKNHFTGPQRMGSVDELIAMETELDVEAADMAEHHTLRPPSD